MNNEFNKRIASIRAVMNNIRMEKYAISVPDMVSLDDYHKSLYLKVLATVIQYENEITEMQDLYYGRIVCGTKSEHSQQDCMRMALEISEDDIAEFISFMSGSVAKYYFSLDGIILVSLSDTSQNGYDYLAELIELIGVGKLELEHIALVAKSVLCRESSYYDDAKNVISEAIEKADFTPYIQNYYTGAIVDNQFCIHYSSPVRDKDTFIPLLKEYRHHKVVFENINIKIEQEAVIFKGCDEVCFYNCNITGSSSMIFISCKKVIVSNSLIHDFTSRIFYINSVPEFLIDGCEIFDNHNKGDEAENALSLVDSNNGSNVIIVNSTIKNCSVYNDNYHSVGSVFCHDYCYIMNSHFINIQGSNRTVNSGHLFYGVIGDDCMKNNEFIGCNELSRYVWNIEDIKVKNNERYQIISKYIKE